MEQQTTTKTMADLIADAVVLRLDVGGKNAMRGLTFGHLFEKWMENYAKPHFVPYSVITYQHTFKNHFDCWKDVAVCDIRRPDVQAWQASIAENSGPGAANRVRDLMRMVFYRAIDWELVPAGYNPASRLRKFRIQSRMRLGR